jgi:hypothetical protein
MFAELAARSNGSEAALIIISLAKAEHRSHGIVRSGSPMMFAASLLSGSTLAPCLTIGAAE